MTDEEADAILDNLTDWRGTRSMSAAQFAEIVEALGVHAGIDVARLRQTLEDVLGPLD